MTEPAAGFSPRIVDSLVDALVIIEASGRVIYANPALGRLLGLDVAGLFGRQLTEFLPERLREEYFAEFVTWMNLDPPPRSPGPTRIAMLHEDGSELPVDVAMFLVTPEQGPRLVIAALWDVRLRIDIVRYQRVADDLMSFLADASGSTDEIVPRLLGIVASSLEFDYATAWRWEGTEQQLHCEYSWCDTPSSCQALIEASVGMTVRPGDELAGIVADSNEARWFGNLTQSPHLRRHDAIVHDGMRSAFVFPIRTTDQMVGVIELFTRAERRPDRALFDAVAEVGARLGGFIERIDLEGERKDLVLQLQRSRAQLRFLLRANLALDEADSFQEAIERLAEVAVPTLGDICLIDMVLPEGGFERLAARHADPALQDSAARLLAYPPDSDGNHPAALAVRTGEPQRSADMSDSFMTSTTQSSEHLAAAQALGFRSYVSVPLLVDDEAMGALTVVTTDAGHPFGDQELHLAQDLARQVARVVERARRMDEQSTIARHLQESLLPRFPIEIAGIDLAVRYEAVGRGAQVGGDFFDAVLVGDSVVALVVGDVEGHDMIATTVMGQLRSAMRAFLTLNQDPAEVLGHLNGFLLGQDSQRIATMVLALLNLVTGELKVATAGHPAPLVGGLDQSVQPLISRPGPPLGVAGARYPVDAVALDHGDLLVFYTDGLIEVGRSGDALRLEKLKTVLSSHPLESCDALADRILATCAGPDHHGDDVALLITRWSPAGVHRSEMRSSQG